MALTLLAYGHLLTINTTIIYANVALSMSIMPSHVSGHLIGLIRTEEVSKSSVLMSGI